MRHVVGKKPYTGLRSRRPKQAKGSLWKHKLKGAAGEKSERKEEQETGNWKLEKGDPCDPVAGGLAKPCLTVIWKLP